MQQVHSEWGMYIAIAMYQITLTSEEEKSYPSCYVKQGYPTQLTAHANNYLGQKKAQANLPT